MYRKSTIKAVPAAVLFAIALQVGVARTSSAQVGGKPALTDSLVTRLSQLEVERISIRVATGDQPDSTQAVNARIQMIRDQLSGLDTNVKRAATQRVLDTLQSREYKVKADLYTLRMKFTDQYPPVRRLIQEDELIVRRFQEIRSSGF